MKEFSYIEVSKCKAEDVIEKSGQSLVDDSKVDLLVGIFAAGIIEDNDALDLDEIVEQIKECKENDIVILDVTVFRYLDGEDDLSQEDVNNIADNFEALDDDGKLELVGHHVFSVIIDSEKNVDDEELVVDIEE